MRECWYKNNTPNDLLLSDLGIKIPAWKTRNLFQIKPSLRPEQVARSEEEGLLAKCVEANKLIKLPFAPPPAKSISLSAEITEAKKPIPSRSKTSVVMDMEELDYIEDMEGEYRSDTASAEKYADYAEGIADPIILETDSEGYETVVVPAGEDEGEVRSGDVVETETQQVGSGNNRYLVVNPAD